MVASIYATQQPAYRADLFFLFVDSVAGNDSNTGETASVPLKTLAAAETAALAFGHGVRIYLKYGSEWRERLHLSSLDRVLVDAYGNPSDGMPIIRCDDILVNASFQDSTQRGDANTNVYSQSFTHVGVFNFVSFWEDDTHLVWAASVAACQATAGTFFFTGGDNGIAGGTVTVYIHPYGDTNAKTDGKKYEGSTRDVAIDARDDGIFRHIWARRAAGQYGALQLRDNALIENCGAEDGTRHDMLVASGTFRHCVGWILFHDSRTEKISLEGYQINGAGKTVTWDACVVVSTVGATYPEVGIGGHTSGNSFDSWFVTDCAVKGCLIGAAGNVSALTVTRPKIDHGRIKHTGSGSTDTLSIVDPWIVGIMTSLGASFSIQPINCAWTIDGLRTYITESYANGLIVPQTNTKQGTLSNSVIVDALAATARRRMLYGDANTKWTSTLNVFKTTGVNTAANEPFVYWNNSGGSATHSADRNVYHATNASFGINFIINSTTYNTVSAYFTAMRPTNDANSVNVNPGVVDPANGNFTLSGSGLPAGVGLQRDLLCQGYTSIPADIPAAKAWLLS